MCLKYLREKRCPWNESTCSGAARGGHLECLKYAHEKGCPWDDETRTAAESYNHLGCMEYCREKGLYLAFDAAVDAFIEDENEILESDYV